MKFGDNKSPNTASFIIDRKEEEKKEQQTNAEPLRITHLTGLGCPEGASVLIHVAEGNLIFDAEWETQDRSGGLMVPKIEKHISSKVIILADIQGIDITDESGRSLGKTALLGAIGLITLGPLGLIGGALLGGRKRYKSFLIIRVKPENKPLHTIVLGGKSQKEIRSYHDYLINIIYSE